MVSLMVIFETPFAETGFFLVTAEMVILYNHVFWRTSTNFADFSVRGLGDIAGDGQLQISWKNQILTIESTRAKGFVPP